jgi:radical SAM protein with 4Fe4S-binding SPASM domain
LEHPAIEQVYRIIDELVKAEVFELRLFGGEPFAFPGWPKAARYAYERGMFLSFVSNGTLITPEVVETLKGYSVTDGAISIHGPEKFHDAITDVAGSYHLAMAGLKACLDGGLQITVITTITRDGSGMIGELIADLSGRNLIRENLSYGVSRLCPFGRGEQDWENQRIPLASYLALFPLLEDISSTYGIPTVFGDAFPECLVPKRYRSLIQGCWQSTGFGHVSSNGDVRGCATSSGKYGNLLETPLERIWGGKEIRAFRKLDWLEDGCKKCKSFCGGGCSASRPNGLMYSPDEFLGGTK